MNHLIPLEVEKHLVLYREMTAAIAACHRVDECKDIINKSIAVAAYFAQIKDDETVLKFNRIRLRAWRRIAELISTVDVSKCETGMDKIRKIRASFDQAALAEITDSQMYGVLKLADISDSDFEYALSQKLKGSIADLLCHTPQAEAEIRNRKTLGGESPTSSSAAHHPTKEEAKANWAAWQARVQREQDETEHLASCNKLLKPP
jgi:hypothetical protein